MAIRNESNYQQLRLAAQIARLYHEQNKTQPEIAQMLSITQTRVSRMLRFAAENGIIRTTVHVPEGIYSDIEDELARVFPDTEFIVVDAPLYHDGTGNPALASSTAAYLERIIPSSEIAAQGRRGNATGQSWCHHAYRAGLWRFRAGQFAGVRDPFGRTAGPDIEC